MVQPYQPLHHKYRPQRLSELVGQEAIAATLGHALRSGRIAPAYLFSGPRGTGKTSSARILARSLNCIASEGPTPDPCGTCELCTSIAAGNALDVIEIDAASNTGVDNIRELIERSRFAPVQARWKVYVIDECHMLSTAAFNALLKTLEEPPPRVVFVLATTDPQRVLPTILSRCQRFDFRRIPLEALEKHLGWIAEREAISISPEALRLVAQRAQGGLRDAESLLDQLSLLPPPVEPEAVWDLLGAVPEQELLQLARSMANGEPLAVVETCRLLMDRGREAGAVLQGLASLLRDLLLAGVAPDRLELTSVSPALRPELPGVARGIGKARLLHWQAQLKGSEQQLRHSVQPRLWLEVLLLGLLAEPAAGGPSAGAAAVSAARAAAAAGSPQPAEAGPAPTLAQQTAATGTAEPRPVFATAEEASPAAPGTGADGEGAGSDGTATVPVTASTGSQNLVELWQQILAGLELPSTRMLLSQQAHLHRLDDRRAVVRVAGNWIAMVQSRLPLLESAMGRALGGARQITLEAGDAREEASSTRVVEPTAARVATPAMAADAGTSHGSDRDRGSQQPAVAAATTSIALPSAGQPDAPAALPERSPAVASAPPITARSGLGSRSAERADPAEPKAPTPAPLNAAATPGQPPDLALDTKTKLFADFFNGEVIAAETDDPLGSSQKPT
jgi:DNA polymerase-3 subunit gamma/tau